MLNIYVANLGKYNEGFLVGEWLELPATQEQITEMYDRIKICHDEKVYCDCCGNPYEEVAIHDYETDIAGIEIGEWSSIDELNELAESLEELNENDREVIEALLEAGYDLEEAMEKKDDCIVWTNCNDMSDVAYEYCQMSGMFENVPDFVERYFDYDAFGRDMDLEGYSHYIFTDCGNCVEIPR